MRLEAITHDVEPASENVARTSGEITAPKSTFTFAIGATAQEISLGSIQLWKTILDQAPMLNYVRIMMFCVPAVLAQRASRNCMPVLRVATVLQSQMRCLIRLQ
jgi:hypothetical protein